MDAQSNEDLLELAANVKGGVPMATPAFAGAREADVSEMLELAGLDSSGQVELYAGRTGQQFHRQVTVVYLYLIKQHHPVDDNTHTRTVAPSSPAPHPIGQQPCRENRT